MADPCWLATGSGSAAYICVNLQLILLLIILLSFVLLYLNIL